MALRYASKDSILRTPPRPTTCTSLATRPTKYWSCDTSTTPPWNAWTASASAATASRSRLLVGSSSTSRCGLAKETAASATRERWPPLSAPAGTPCCAATTPQPARCPRSSCSCCVLPSPGNRANMKASGVLSYASWSAWCWLTSATRAPRFSVTTPCVGSRWPSITFTNVVLPSPFSPSKHTRDSLSKDMSTLAKRSASMPGYLNATFSSFAIGPRKTPPAARANGSSASSDKSAVSSASAAPSSSSLVASLALRCIMEICEDDPPNLNPCPAYAVSLSFLSLRSATRRCRAFCCSSRLAAHAE
mmetsp:Transcript_28460/g.71308  ORF Transcript_28460/g.71308 Transcript_28460/m.71308 type:complete len:305 (-) Transcript_28460:154-1068(-)